MLTVKKKDLKKEKEIDELVDSEGAIISGDRNAVSNSEIETGPVDKSFNDTSDYEKGVSTTTDRAARYKQNIPWFANYGYGAKRTTGVSESDQPKVFTKKTVEEKVDDLVKRKRDRDLTEKSFDSKLTQIISIIEDNDFSADQLEQIKKSIETKSAINNNRL